MFKSNNIYIRNYSECMPNAEVVGGMPVELYPENQLSPLIVASDFGDCQVIVSDVYDLFNQSRIESFGVDVVRDFIARNYPITSPISEQISKMSDDDIIASIKPRNIQSYSELLSWSKFLNKQIEDGLNNISSVDSDSSVVSSDTDDNSNTKSD